MLKANIHRTMPRPRSGSKKGAATPKVAATPKLKKAADEVVVTVYEMAFTEGDAIMAKWPGTNLYFNAKVTFVRDEDNEYDVQVCNISIFSEPPYSLG